MRSFVVTFCALALVNLAFSVPITSNDEESRVICLEDKTGLNCYGRYDNHLQQIKRASWDDDEGWYDSDDYYNHHKWHDGDDYYDHDDHHKWHDGDGLYGGRGSSRGGYGGGGFSGGNGFNNPGGFNGNPNGFGGNPNGFGGNPNGFNGGGRAGGNPSTGAPGQPMQGPGSAQAPPVALPPPANGQPRVGTSPSAANQGGNFGAPAVPNGGVPSSNGITRGNAIPADRTPASGSNGVPFVNNGPHLITIDLDATASIGNLVQATATAGIGLL
ncbi:hypothetical protein BU17DRAFT_60823 [Hysterangium stoloniferum]|nr:hypothetical protein BU17DRAFT_60823 [Hysterangium stoloniferum]